MGKTRGFGRVHSLRGYDDPCRFVKLFGHHKIGELNDTVLCKSMTYQRLQGGIAANDIGDRLEFRRKCNARR